MEPSLFSPLQLKDVVLRNRIGVSPMCQYSSDDGAPTDWHLVHLGARAVGGAGLIMTEATAVEARGRISAVDMGLWDDRQIEGHARLTRFEKQHGAAPGIQLAHAGRKASSARSWDGGKHLTTAQGGWDDIIGPSAVAFGGGQDRVPREMTEAEIRTAQQAFAAAAKRALAAGYEWLEIHSAHGYLSHSYLSPLSNRRTDRYGGSFENRARFLRETVRAVRAVWPERRPLAVRLSATDWVEGGWTIEDSVALARLLKEEGVDLVDCSSGGSVPDAKIPAAPGFQVPFAEKIRREAAIATAAVGMITEPRQADEIIRTGQADLVLLARESLRDPYWPLRAAKALGASVNGLVSKQYLRGW